MSKADPATAAEYRESMTEGQLQDCVVELARTLGYLVYHTYDSRRSAEGFPDLVMVLEETGRLLFVELKSTKGRISAAQQFWLAALSLAKGHEVHVWRPRDWHSGRIEEVLRRW